MALTIYTISDPATIGAAMTSMAMFFGQDDWVGSAIKTALMLSLIFILAQGVTRNGLRLDVMLIQLLVVWAMFLPKTTVTIEQFNNAAPPRVVDHVPYAIAYPATLAGSFAMFMTNSIETVSKSVNTDYIPVAGDMSPFTPARMLMTFTTCPMDPLSCIDKNLAETMRLGARYCPGPDMAGKNFQSSQNVLSDFAAGCRVAARRSFMTPLIHTPLVGDQVERQPVHRQRSICKGLPTTGGMVPTSLIQRLSGSAKLPWLVMLRSTLVVQRGRLVPKLGLKICRK